MPSIRDRNGGIEPEEEDVDQCEQDEEDDSESGSPDDQEDDDECGSSEADPDECDRRRSEYMDDMGELSEQFCKIKDQLFNERQALIEVRLKAIRAGKDSEYLSRLDRLDKNRKNRIEVADIRREFNRATIEERFKAEELSLSQTLQNNLEILQDQLKQELEDKIKRLEEDRHSIDFPQDFMEPQKGKHRYTPFDRSERYKKKVTIVTGPYIVYNLADDDIMSDWTLIKRVTKQQNQRRKVEL